MRTFLSWTLLVLGSVLLALSIPAGYINRTVLDAPTFANKVNELRQRDDVSDVLGREIGQQIITQNPDLVALAPLVNQISIGVVGSDVLSGPVKLAASQFNRALTTDNSDQLVLRVADVGSVVAGVIGAVAPERAPRASNLSITLANVGDQAFASNIIGYAHLVDTLAWLLPLLAVVSLVAAVFVQPDRWAAIHRVGWAAIIAVVVLAALVVLGGIVVRSAGGDARADAIVNGVWDLFIRPVWWSLGLVAGIGALLVMVGSGRRGRLESRGVRPAGDDRPIDSGPGDRQSAGVRRLRCCTDHRAERHVDAAGIRRRHRAGGVRSRCVVPAGRSVSSRATGR